MLDTAIKNKVLCLLCLCLDAQEKGHDIFFEYMPHVQKVFVHKYKDCDEDTDYENREFEFNIDFYLDEEGAELAVNIAIDRVKQVIGSDTNET